MSQFLYYIFIFFVGFLTPKFFTSDSEIVSREPEYETRQYQVAFQKDSILFLSNSPKEICEVIDYVKVKELSQYKVVCKEIKK